MSRSSIWWSDCLFGPDTGFQNSGHAKAAAYVIRNVEVGGEHKPRRFSTWAPKALATIRFLPDTLEDRAIVVQLQLRVCIGTL
jgi:hypothetical protein